MLRMLLVRGMLVGAIASLLMFAMAQVFGEPPLDRALAFEAQMEAASGHAKDSAMPGMDMSGGEELVSRQVQSTWGLLTGAVVYGTAIGGVFALVYAFAWGRVKGIGPRSLAALLALAGFLTIVLVPGLKYPANPPGGSLAATINLRTELFLSMIVISIVALIAAIQLFRALIISRSAWNAALAGAAVYVVIVGIAQFVLPSIQEVPDNFPAAVLWDFRIANWGMHLVLWAAIGLLFGYLTERSLARSGSLQRAS